MRRRLSRCRRTFCVSVSLVANYILRRLGWALVVTIGVTTLVFILIRTVGGDPAEIRMGELVQKNPEAVEVFRRKHNLHLPIYEQYFLFVKGALHGDFGDSIISGRPAGELLKRGLRVTVPLGVLALFFSVVIGMGLGMLAAFRHRTWVDSLSSFLALIGVAMPSFYLAMLLMLFGGIYLGWFPVLGGIGLRPLEDPLGALHKLFLPALAVGLYSAASICRRVRSSILEELRKQYITVARAKGIHQSLINIRHALRNALIPTVTIIGLQIADLISGLIFVELVFTLPGVGRIFLEAIAQRDFIVIQACVFFFAISFSIINLATDLLYPVLNPKVRLQ